VQTSAEVDNTELVALGIAVTDTVPTPTGPDAIFRAAPVP